MNKQQLIRVGEHELPVPSRASAGDFGYDVRARETVTLQPWVPTLVGIGFALATPLPNVAMLVVPRSSTRKQYQCIIPNSPGLIDAYYGDEIKVQLENLGCDDITLVAGERFAQLMFVPVVLPELVEVIGQHTSMNRKGFGSTGSR